MATPNTAPAFIRNVGIIGQPVALTNQVCTRDNPGTTPVVIYDSSASYASGNGAFVECFQCNATGVSVAVALLVFHRLPEETSPQWRLAFESSIPEVVAVGDSAFPNFPVYIPLPLILFPVPHAGDAEIGAFRGLRINGGDRAIQWGVALSRAVGNFPLIVTMYGGEY